MIYAPGSSKGFRSKVLVTGEVHDFDLSFEHLERLMEINGEFLLFFDAPAISDKRIAHYIDENREKLIAFGGENISLTGKWNGNMLLRSVIQGFMLRMHNAGYTAEGNFHLHQERLYYTVLCLKRSSRKKIESSLGQRTSRQYELFA